MARLTHLDTHAVIWLYAGELDRFTPAALEGLRSSSPVISPIVPLEIQYLFEVGKITVHADTVVEALQRDIGLSLSEHSFQDVARRSLHNSWTRDPFDRIIAADAAIGEDRLLTKDEIIRAHYRHAFWS